MSLFDAINQALGANESHAGLVLAQAVDRLTPDGTLPAGGLLGQAAGLLRGLR